MFVHARRVDGDGDRSQSGSGQFFETRWKQPAVGDDYHAHASPCGHRHEVRNARVQKRLSTEKIYVSDIARMEDIERVAEATRVYPAQLSDLTLVMGEVAELASRIAGICDGDIADCGPSTTNKLRQFPNMRERRSHN
jgi:hypothetical protein